MRNLKVAISDDECLYLQQLVSRDESLRELLVLEKRTPRSAAKIRLEPTDVERVRDRLTLELASVGFDGSYSVNKYGEMLEDIIDKLFSFKSVVYDILSRAPIPELMKSHDAVVLERIAFGGGETRWYYCPAQTSLETLATHLSPGSVVSFCFDNRIRSALCSSDLIRDVKDFIVQFGEAVVGVLAEDRLVIDVDFVCDSVELDELLSPLDPSRLVFYGAFPARDNDGSAAVTVTIADEDGVVRPHPH